MWAIYRGRWVVAALGFLPFASLMICDFGLSDDEVNEIMYPLNFVSSILHALYGGQVEFELKKEDG
jgi:hypothetical protein